MTEAKRQIFRKESLERLHNAEELDQLLHVVQPRSWWTLGAAAVVLGLTLVWGFLGRIPITVEGVAFLTHIDGMLPFQAQVRAQVRAVHVDPNDRVQMGALLVTLSLPELDSQIELQSERVARARELGQEILDIQNDFATSDKKLLDEQLEELDLRLKRTDEGSDEFKLASRDAFIELHKALTDAEEKTGTLVFELTAFQDALKELSTQGDGSSNKSGNLVSRLEVLQNRIRLTDQQLRAVEQTSRRKQLILEETRDGLTLASMLDRVGEVKAAKHELEIELDAIDKRIKLETLKQKLLLEGLEAELELLESRHKDQSRVLASAAGTVVEVLHHPGELVDVGQRLGRIELAQDGSELTAVAYFAIDAGKRVRIGHELHVTPDTVERARFGGILAEAFEVSRFPVSQDAAAHRLGGPELAELLLAGQSRIEVLARLEASSEFDSGFRWSSGHGPDEPVTEGTTARVRVTIEERPPITFVFPFLEAWLDS